MTHEASWNGESEFAKGDRVRFQDSKDGEIVAVHEHHGDPVYIIHFADGSETDAYMGDLDLLPPTKNALGWPINDA